MVSSNSCDLWGLIRNGIIGNPFGIPTFLHYGLGGGRYTAWIFHSFAVEAGLRLIVPDRPK